MQCISREPTCQENLLDDYFKALGVNERSFVYPVFRYFELLEPAVLVE